LLFIGDIVGAAGRRALLRSLGDLRSRYQPTFVVVNGENAAGGQGITPSIADQFFASGVDVITLGNHAFRQRSIYGYLDEQPYILRPMNYLHRQPGHGSCMVTRDGVRLGVINLLGNLFLNAPRPAFTEIDFALDNLPKPTDYLLVDFHAEATSEKVAMGHYLDGRVTAVVGTHTHVPTADARILPQGTAYISDVGMTGARASVIGVKTELALHRLTTQMPVRFEAASGDPWLMGVLISAEQPPYAQSIEQILEPVPGAADGQEG
jgi:metallophosphoesterase (TIGR00282 family)